MEHKNKILIVSKSFYPELSPRSFRATELAKEFARQGHDVTVLTKRRDFDYSEFIREYKVKLKDFGKLKLAIGNKESGWLKTPKRKLRRLLFMLFEYPDIEIMYRLKKVLKEENSYDLMISSAFPYPVHWGVAYARSKTSPIAKTWIADCGDPYMGLTLESFKRPFYFKYIEKWFCKKADFLSVPTEGAINGYYSEFRQKIRVIPQGFNFNEVRLSEPKSKDKNIVEFAYAGGISAKGVRSPHRFIEILLSLNCDFKFHVFASTGQGEIQKYVNRSEGRILLHQPIPRQELLFELSKMDFLVNFDNGTSKQTPSKLIDYSLTGRPILNILPERPEEIMVREFIRKDYSRQYVVEDIQRYNIVNVADQFLLLGNGSK